MNEEQLLQYFYDINFEKKLKNISKKLKGKKVIIYGCGMMFNLIQRYFDISELNIIGVYDGRFADTDTKEYNGFPVIKPENFCLADVIIVSTWNTIDIIENLKQFNVKALSLVQKKFKDILKEIWS